MRTSVTAAVSPYRKRRVSTSLAVGTIVSGLEVAGLHLRPVDFHSLRTGSNSTLSC